MIEDLEWNDRFAIITHYDLNEQEACNVLNVDAEKLRAATRMHKMGYFTTEPTVDFLLFADKIKKMRNDAPSKIQIPDVPDVVRVPEIPETVRVPEGTATPKPKDSTTQNPKDHTTPKAKKRGRPGDKIKKAYAAVTAEKVPVDEFREQHNVSLSVLRRHKDFDHLKETGKINVKKVVLPGDTEKTLCIWRDFK